MDIIKISAVGIIASVICITLKRERPEFAVCIALASGFMILMMCTDKLINIFTLFKSIIDKSGIAQKYFASVVKIISIAYICQYASELCRDCGESAIGVKIELAGKILILLLTLPLIEAFLSLCINTVNSI